MLSPIFSVLVQNRSMMSRMVIAAAIGSAIGSALVGLWCMLWGLSNRASSTLFSVVAAFIVPTVFAVVCSFLPVLAITAILAPLAERLATRTGETNQTKYFIIVTGLVTAPWLLIGPIGLLGSAAMLLSYGYPTAAFYLWLGTRRGPTVY